jgi:succinylarginine dihydrolase
MRLSSAHGEAGVEIFVYGRSGGPFPARQNAEASRIVARRHGLDPDRVLFIDQSAQAIAAGAFHNDVVAVANERVLFAHEQAFADPGRVYEAIREKFREVEIVTVPASAVSLSEAVGSYLFNAQLVTLPSGDMALVVPTEASDSPPVRKWLEGMLAGNGPIRRVIPADVRQSMANGGGPACLRLRVVADPPTVDQRFLLDQEKAARIELVIAQHWPETLDPQELGDKRLADRVRAARLALLDALDLAALA